MMNHKFLLLILISLLLFSCKSPKFITSEKNYNKLNLGFSSDSISIIDERVTISQDEMKIPFISVPNQLYNYYPKLNQEYQDIIKNTIYENLNTASKTNSIITVYVIEARKEFSTTFSAEQELVAITLKLVIEIDGEKIEIIESGKFYKRSMDATYKYFEKLFQESLKEITFNGLKRAKYMNSQNNSK